ncbi:MAG: sodium:solute symporter [candidate division KSB1 bacterium]|nr:sodium:solute symporter [candidate division KSB1 bacterium]
MQGETVGWPSVLPPLVAIALAISTRQVYLSLFVGVWLGWTILSGLNPLTGAARALDAIVQVFQDPANTKVILFSTLMGVVIVYTQYSGGMQGFVDAVVGRGWVRSRRQAGLLAWLIGMVIFVESSICVLVAGTVARPLFDRLRISREKLAYICDSTSAPKCILIPLNAWGAFVIGLLSEQGVASPVETFLRSMPYNFYALLAIGLVLFSVLLDWNVGPMRAAERRVREEGKLLWDGSEPLISTDVLTVEAKDKVAARARNMTVPLAALVTAMPVGLLVTGGGNLMRGSGSTAVLWAVLVSIAIAGLMYRAQRIMSLRELSDQFMRGAGGLMPLAALMVFAFALGSLCRQLGTGIYVAQVAERWLSPKLVPLVVFAASCFIAFATGTSWGTFAVMMPIAVPMASLLGVPLAPTVAAVLGGGVFGDHCSPISDTTIIASMASACDHIDHVRTQLPYALLAAGISAILYLVVGWMG